MNEKISNPDKTIIISKQAFAEKAVSATRAVIDLYELGPNTKTMFALYLTILTHELFEEDTYEGLDED